MGRERPCSISARPRSDSEPSPVLGDQLTDHRRRGTLSRTKKLVAAFRISTVCSSSPFLRFSSRISRADSVVPPGMISDQTNRLRCRACVRWVDAGDCLRPSSRRPWAHLEYRR